MSLLRIVLERKNRSLCEMAWTMLDEHRTMRKYWDEAVNTTCHVGNQIFLRVFLKKTCYVLMHGLTPSVSHFELLVASALVSRRVSIISLRQGLPMVFFLVMLIILEQIVCSILTVTKSWRLAR
jgi:hypothetical protein